MKGLLKFAEKQGFSCKFICDDSDAPEILVEDKETDITVWGRKRFEEWNVSLAYPSVGLPRPSIEEVEHFAEILQKAIVIAKKFREYNNG
jgi:hypothetical protein